jgi:hypothetical protein
MLDGGGGSFALSVALDSDRIDMPIENWTCRTAATARPPASSAFDSLLHLSDIETSARKEPMSFLIVTAESMAA